MSTPQHGSYPPPPSQGSGGGRDPYAQPAGEHPYGDQGAHGGQPQYGVRSPYAGQGAPGAPPQYGQPAHGAGAASGQPGQYGQYGQYGQPGPAGDGSRPKPLSLAVKLMWAGALASLLHGLTWLLARGEFVEGFLESAQEDSADFTTSDLDALANAIFVGLLLFFVVCAALWALHAWANGKGHMWARITGTILGVLWIIATLPAFLGLLAGDLASILMSLTAMLIGFIALVTIILLWNPSNRVYFQRR